MSKHRVLVVGAGRIGASYDWHDERYTHAGAVQALALHGRCELVGFVEPDIKRAVAAKRKWEVPVYENVPIAVEALRPTIVSVCTQPDEQAEIISLLEGYRDLVKGIYCEKPYVSRVIAIPTQVNYLRRADANHQAIANNMKGGTLVVFGKEDVHTRCHFVDLGEWWDAKVNYYPIDGPCSYDYIWMGQHTHFPSGGVDGGSCMKAMLGNLLGHVDSGEPLWSPAR